MRREITERRIESNELANISINKATGKRRVYYKRKRLFPSDAALRAAGIVDRKRSIAKSLLKSD